MKLRLKALTGALLLAPLCTTATQFDYFGISLQHNRYDKLNFSAEIDVSTLAPLLYEESAAATGFRVFWGHQFNNYIAVEAGVVSLGKAKFSVVQQETAADGVVSSTVIQSGDFKTLAADVRAVATYPVNDSLFLKAHLGAVVWNNRYSFLTGDTTDLATAKASDTGVSLLTGIGIGYGFNNKIAISVDFEKVEIARADTENLGISLLMRF